MYWLETVYIFTLYFLRLARSCIGFETDPIMYGFDHIWFTKVKTDVLLAALAISDAVKLINDLLYSATCATMQVDPDAGQSMYAYLYPYAHFVFNAAVCVSAWLVVSLAVERYLLVCWPTRTRHLTSAARSRTSVSRSVTSISESFTFSFKDGDATSRSNESRSSCLTQKS